MQVPLQGWSSLPLALLQPPPPRLLPLRPQMAPALHQLGQCPLLPRLQRRCPPLLRLLRRCHPLPRPRPQLPRRRAARGPASGARMRGMAATLPVPAATTCAPSGRARSRRACLVAERSHARTCNGALPLYRTNDCLDTFLPICRPCAAFPISLLMICTAHAKRHPFSHNPPTLS